MAAENGIIGFDRRMPTLPLPSCVYVSIAITSGECVYAGLAEHQSITAKEKH